ncbi:hypothetical protein AURDEDRAFT_169838 [Auricularia subglabra TFB-10046 SS5]|nr:hypothetical protein AURDEDRAFT_169838 [Auricularia subglabra TFB-10046 SS5]
MSASFIAVNGTCDRLSDDVLAYIMALVVGASSSIPEKLALAQVSQRWRAVAVNTTALWANFTVQTRGDALIVPTVMERARGALLHVSLDFGVRREPQDAHAASTVPLIDFDTRAVIYAYLSPQIHRIRSLSIDFGPSTSVVGPGEPLGELFPFAISQMKELSIHWTTNRWQRVRGAAEAQPVQPIVIPLELPTEIPSRLRVLRLTNVVPEDWSTAITPALEILHIDATLDDAAPLIHVLQTCPHLTQMTFLPSFVVPPASALAVTGTDPPPSVCTRLGAVHIGSPFMILWDVLGAVLDRKNLDRVFVNLRDEDPRTEVVSAARTMLPSIGPPVACSLVPIHPDACECIYSIKDATGRSRNIVVHNATQEQAPFGDLWAHFVAHGDLDTIRHITFCQWYWLTIVDAFPDFEPPRHPDLELRIVLMSRRGESRDDERFVAMLDHEQNMLAWTLQLPTLARLTFDVGGALPEDKLAVVLAMLDNITGRHGAQRSQVCVANCSQRQLWVPSMRAALATRHEWVLCENGCSHL